MKHILFPDRRIRPLPFYLAAEEWVARRLPPDDYFFAWRVSPTVICGRNQNIAAEVDLDYCRENGIDVVRRRSGGGCVFADMQNYMFSYITAGDAVQSVFARYTTTIAAMLCSLGIEAGANGRNDIVVADGRKISGNAFYHLPSRCIVHGTMLYDIDPRHMSRAITPSRAKLLSKGVQSVPMRVTCLREQGLTMDIEEFCAYAVAALTDSELRLSEKDVAQIEEIERSYRDPEWLRVGDKACDRRDTIVRHAHIDGVGEVQAEIVLDGAGRIAAVGLTGDFFLLGDPDEFIVSRLRGVPYARGAILDALAAADPAKAVAGLNREAFADVLID